TSSRFFPYTTPFRSEPPNPKLCSIDGGVGNDKGGDDLAGLEAHASELGLVTRAIAADVDAVPDPLALERDGLERGLEVLGCELRSEEYTSELQSREN